MSRKKPIVIAIDGPAGAGKSTVAKRVARSFSFLYIDSGAMYRAVAWKALREHVDLTDEKAVAELARGMKIDLKPTEEGARVWSDGVEITQAIRMPEVTDASSKVATIAAVRRIMVERQQAMARTSDVVMEGRDIGTVVFPDSRFKFYLDASARERAVRRKRDLEQAGHRVDLEDLESEILERDKRDSTRAVGSLRKGEDAMLIDTTHMTIEQVVQTISDRVRTLCEQVMEA
jgi:cytidylate kinase